jgi:hypothetical protein
MMQAQRIQMLHGIWWSLGSVNATAAAADSALGVTERLLSTAKLLTNSVSNKISEQVLTLFLRFKSATNNAVATFDIWVSRKDSDDLVRVCTVAVTMGNQDAGDGKKLADTITITNDTNWLGSVRKVEPGTDLQAALLFEPSGFDNVLLHAYGTCTEAVTVEASGS